MNLKVTYIGHATTLLELGEDIFLTDPFFSNKFFFLKRKKPLQFNPANLPRLSGVLMTHAHFNHLNHSSLKYIPSNIPFIVAEGIEKYLGKITNNPIIELATWSKFQIGKTEICCTPAECSIGRTHFPLSFKKGAGFILRQSDKTIYFAGHTAYGPHMKKIGELFEIDLALLPVKAKSLDWYFNRKELDAQNAILSFRELKAKKMIPIYCDTFTLGNKSKKSSLQLKTQSEKEGVLDSIHFLEDGETYWA